MSRQRLSWDERKVAELMKNADPYTMNQTRQNPPVEKYQTGDPDAWGETPNMAMPWKSEGRTETGHPAPAREAVVGARKLEDKALKCITIAHRMLPGADDSMIEEQATDFMYMPEKAILATLQRQAALAEKLAAEKTEKEEEPEEKTSAKKTEKEEEPEEKTSAKKTEEEDGEEVEAAKKTEKEEEPEEKTSAKKTEEEDGEEVEAAKKTEKEEEPEEKTSAKKTEKEEEPEEKTSAKKTEKEEPEEKTSAKKTEKEEEPEEKTSAKKTEKSPEEEEEVEASDLLDQLFQDSDKAVTASESKQGAKKLSGIVKQASSGGDPQLAELWDAPPDISTVFK